MSQHITVARRVLATEIAALEVLSAQLGEAFSKIVERLKTINGRIILVGVGKSGHVARKIAATLASTGSPAIYVHPTEASHGDMGLITPGDAVIALSRSGETTELADIIAYTKRFDIPLIALTTQPNSTLAKSATDILALPDAPEACAETRAPTTSTTLQIAVGDALAVALLEAKGFTATDFKTFHPGGALGASLLTVRELMHTGDMLPLCSPDTDIDSVIAEMSAKGFGCVGVVQDGHLSGMITDGDIRRNLAGLADKIAQDIMTPTPKTAAPDDLAADALRHMTADTPKVMQLFVIEKNTAIGVVHMHDFLRAGLL